MKKISIIILIGLVSCNSEPKKRIDMAEKQLDIMFYNIENLFDTFDDEYTNDDDFLPEARKEWDDEKFYNKIDKIGEVILSVNKKGPLFIGMVEVENKYVLNQLLESRRLRDINYKFCHFDSPDKRGIDVALIYNKDYFTVNEKEPLVIHLPKQDKTRDILYVKGQIVGDDSEYHLFVNHWPSRREGTKKSEPKRIEVAIVLRNKIDEIQTKDDTAKIIVMGDFNDYPNNNSIKNYLKAKNSSNISSNELFNLAARLEDNDKGSYNYKGDWGMMDQMMVSKSMLDETKGKYSVNQKGLKIFDEDFIMYFDKRYNELKPNKTYGGDNYYGGYSDHLPIYIRLKTKK